MFARLPGGRRFTLKLVSGRLSSGLLQSGLSRSCGVPTMLSAVGPLRDQADRPGDTLVDLHPQLDLVSDGGRDPVLLDKEVMPAGPCELLGLLLGAPGGLHLQMTLTELEAHARELIYLQVVG